MRLRVVDRIRLFDMTECTYVVARVPRYGSERAMRDEQMILILRRLRRSQKLFGLTDGRTHYPLDVPYVP